MIQLWNAAAGRPVGSPLQAGSAVTGVAFSPDGSLLASAGVNGEVRFWDVATGQPSGSPMQAGSALNGVAFSPDGKVLATAGANGTVRLWNVPAGQPAGRGSGYWLILVGAVIAIVLSALAALITTREIWPARRR
jgi:WD40 repeat protein